MFPLNMEGAGVYGKVSSRFGDLEPPNAEFLVASHGVFHRGLCPGKGWWVYDNHIKLFSSLLELSQEVKGIVLYPLYAINLI